MSETPVKDGLEGVAIIGLAGRFPGARNLEQFWRNLVDGVESVSLFSDEELMSAGADPSHLEDPSYVKAAPELEDIEFFDAGFFGFSPRETELMDPQQRLFLECAWEALETAGYDSERTDHRIGVYAGARISTYWLDVCSGRNQVHSPEGLSMLMGNDKDYLATKVSYKLNLNGPSIGVQTACSTSLVAVALACQGILTYQCDMALAGGVSVGVPQKSGYFFRPGGIASPDGHCRAFDAEARGSVFGSGVGIVVLKRLEDALADGDMIHAVVRGAAINNDGARKVGYTAPSVEGQSQVIATAQAIAGVEARTITYVETNGTGTELGDPIEITALQKAFGDVGGSSGFCALGSVKTNIGHLHTAAGIAGLIKTVLALRHGVIPPSLNFETPNPEIDFSRSPFYVNTVCKPWSTDGMPRRAGVSSFGIGGTNAHVVLEEGPSVPGSGPGRPWHLWVLSARSESALSVATRNLVSHLEVRPDLDPADVAYTLMVGRRPLPCRRIVVERDLAAATEALSSLDAARVATAHQERRDRRVVFLFPGQGAQHVGMGRELYEGEPVFRDVVDHCAEFLQAHLALDLRKILYPSRSSSEGILSERLRETALAQPALFVVEYALAKLLISWGLEPRAFAGLSVGEYVAACLAGVFRLEDALTVVAARARLMQSQPAGEMLAVSLSAAEVQDLLTGGLALAEINAPELVVVSGPSDQVEALRRRFDERGVGCRPLDTSHAFHSVMMDPVLEPFRNVLRGIGLSSPQIPVLSNLTGKWLRAEEATDPGYWTAQLRHTSRFSDNVRELLTEPEEIILEVGPGHGLATFVRAQAGGRTTVLSSLPHPKARASELAFVLKTLGRLWLAGARVDWPAFYAGQRRRRVALPTYPFERRRYWIDDYALGSDRGAPGVSAQSRKAQTLADWFYVPAWKQSPLPPALSSAEVEKGTCWLILLDPYGLGQRLGERLGECSQPFATVEIGERYQPLGDDHYAIDPRHAEDYVRLLSELRWPPGRIIDAWGLGEDTGAASVDLCFHSLLFLGQALADLPEKRRVEIRFLSDGLQSIAGEPHLAPEKATALGPCMVIPQELSNLSCQSIDLEQPQRPADRERLVEQVLAEIGCEVSEPVVAYRGPDRWARRLEPLPLREALDDRPRMRGGGIYLVTGGFGGLGFAVAQELARTLHARLVLVGRSSIPERVDWQEWLEAHPDDDPISERICRVLTLEELGAEVLALSADVADREQMMTAVAHVRQRFGSLDGVFHAAGVAGGGLIRLSNRETAAAVLAPKVLGTQILAAAVDELSPDFLVLFSSTVAMTGGVGQVDYCAANAFLDAFARARTVRGGDLTVSIGWDAWRAMGLTAQAPDQGGWIDAERGLEAMRRILCWARQPQIAVSPRDLPAVVREAWKRGPEAAQERFREPRASGGGHPRPDLQNPYVAPSNDIEERVAEVWRNLLAIDRIGARDDFFELGGHSLLAVRVMAEIRSSLGVELPMQILFDEPTLERLARRIEAEKKAATHPAPPPIEPVSRDGDLPLSFAQERHWVLARLDPRSSIYNQVAGTRLTGHLRVPALEHSLTEIVRRHEILRTTYAAEGGHPVQRIGKARPVSVPEVDLSGLSEPWRQREIDRLIACAARQPFDLDKGPLLLRTLLLRLGPREHLIVFGFHHVAGDYWSAGVLVRELAALYEACCAGQPSPLPDLPVQYADFAVWQRRWMREEVLEDQLSYWRRQLAGAPSLLPLPTDRPRPAAQTFTGARCPVRFARRLSTDFEELCREQGVTLFMGLLSGLVSLLFHLTGQDDIVVGSPVAGRDRTEVEGLVGCFINALALRTQLAGDPSFVDLLARVRQTTLGAYRHQDLPFEKLVKELQPKRDPSYTPLFQVVFNFQSDPRPPFRLSGLHLSPLDIDTGRAKYDFTLYLGPRDDGFHGVLEYNVSLFIRETAENMMESLEALLAKVVQQPEIRLSALRRFLTQREKDQNTMKLKRMDQSNLKKLRQVRRRAVSVTPESLVTTGYLSDGQRLPLVVQPKLPEIELAKWAGKNLDWIEERLMEHGAILFRGFGVESAESFSDVVNTITPELINYVEGSSPRIIVHDKVYTSTEYPPEYFVSMHNELSYAHRWPSKIFFFCLKAAKSGGETPIADSRAVFQNLPAEIRERFEKKRVTYLRKLHGGKGAGLAWQTVFETDDKATVEDYCREGNIDFEWTDEDGLRTRQSRPAVITHPKTGEKLWFNQVDQWHPSNLEKEVADALLTTTVTEDLPIYATFGDGEPLDEAELEAVRTAFRETMVSYPWQEGDVLVADNMLVAHGRMPFEGPRRVLVAMGGAVGLEEVGETR